uniref:CAAX prenyl protease 1 N-terminal domain-containing protein n=1 Tax=Octopus bimaculoides TaxID=37653 RepID=A0A0L8HNF6_OCTBM
MGLLPNIVLGFETIFQLGVVWNWIILILKFILAFHYKLYLNGLKTPPLRRGIPFTQESFDELKSYQSHRIYFYCFLALIKCSFVTSVYIEDFLHSQWIVLSIFFPKGNFVNNDVFRTYMITICMSLFYIIYHMFKWSYINFILKNSYHFPSESISSFFFNHFVQLNLSLVFFLSLLTIFLAGHHIIGGLFLLYVWTALIPFIVLISLWNEITSKPQELNDVFRNSVRRIASLADINIKNVELTSKPVRPNFIQFNLALFHQILFRKTIRIDRYFYHTKEDAEAFSWKLLNWNNIEAIACHQISQWNHGHTIRAIITWIFSMFFPVIVGCYLFSSPIRPFVATGEPVIIVVFNLLMYVVDPYYNSIECCHVTSLKHDLKEADQFVEENLFGEEFHEVTVKIFHLEMENEEEVSIYSSLYHPRNKLYEKTISTYRFVSQGV